MNRRKKIIESSTYIDVTNKTASAHCFHLLMSERHDGRDISYWCSERSLVTSSHNITMYLFYTHFLINIILHRHIKNNTNNFVRKDLF